MIGSSDPTQYDGMAIVVLACLALVLLAGVITGEQWPPQLSISARFIVPLLAAVVVVSLLVVTPTRNGIVGAGRMITLWPAVVVNVLLFAVWTWRAGRR